MQRQSPSKDKHKNPTQLDWPHAGFNDSRALKMTCQCGQAAAGTARTDRLYRTGSTLSSLGSRLRSETGFAAADKQPEGLLKASHEAGTDRKSFLYLWRNRRKL